MKKIVISLVAVLLLGLMGVTLDSASATHPHRGHHRGHHPGGAPYYGVRGGGPGCYPYAASYRYGGYGGYSVPPYVYAAPYGYRPGFYGAGVNYGPYYGGSGIGYYGSGVSFRISF
jgi:hypothetical protein